MTHRHVNSGNAFLKFKKQKQKRCKKCREFAIIDMRESRCPASRFANLSSTSYVRAFQHILIQHLLTTLIYTHRIMVIVFSCNYYWINTKRTNKMMSANLKMSLFNRDVLMQAQVYRVHDCQYQKKGKLNNVLQFYIFKRG